jgi:predicted neuraminidase
MPADTAAAHASNLVAMPLGNSAALTAFWFAGDRESAPNVQIAASQWSRASQQWVPARFVVNRHAMGRELSYGLRRLGNPVAWLDGEGRIHLFVVATGWGGWAASRVLQLRQSSTSNALKDLQFEPVRVLPLSWLWNISYLVRNPPLPLADGGMVLPVHFELGTKHASALHFDAQGAYRGMVRISKHHDRLQPTLVMESPTDWWAFMRVQREQGKVAVSRSRDAGRNWEDQVDLSLDNPDAAVAGMGLAPHRMVLAYNPSVKGRTALHLGESGNGQSWTVAAVIEKGAEPDEFSYPAMAWSDGKLWVTYTADRTHIQWQRFIPAPTNTRGAP